MKTIIDIITPTNLPQEKKKFFSSTTYNPQFTYNWDTKELETFISTHLYYGQLVRCIMTQDISGIVREAEKVFETHIDSHLLELANKIVGKKPQIQHNLHFSIEEITTTFQKALDILDLPYKLEVTDKKGFNFRPNYKKRIILMNEDINFQFLSLDGGIKHELTHVLRYENGKHNNIKKSKNYLPTEEGLATYMQDYYGESGEASLFQHAAEYCVTDIGLKSPLRTMYNYLCSIGFSEELAWQRAIRHKFGFMDTAIAGDIMKPSMYFYTEQKIKNLSQEDLLKLFVGKISLQDLQRIEIYKGKISKKRLINFYHLTS